MKQIKFFNYLLVVVLCLGFTSCNDDDNYDPAELVGTWQMISEKGWRYENGSKKTYEYDTAHEYIYYILNDDYTGYFYYYEDPRHYFTWKLEGNQITITENGETDPRYYGTISLNGEQFLIEERGRDEEGDEYYDLTVFTKARIYY